MAVAKDQETTFIGKTNFRGSDRIFGIRAKDRRQHMYVVGKTGTGKTALLKNMALQDIRAGRGIGIIDPHGEFVEDLLEQIPEERTNDVVYFNPVDSEYPIGFNVLEVSDTKYKHLVVSDLLGIFTKIWANVWSARMEYILQNCILALLDTPGTTLLGIPRLLVDKDYRQRILANVKDPVVRSFWMHEYETWRDQFRNEAIVPIQNKVGQFLNTSFIRNIVGQETSTLNIPEIMNSGKILLVNVSKGKIGEDNSGLLGAMIITKIQLAAMERVRISEEDRQDFYLYVDEFQNFATDSFAGILSEARKYRLDLIIAHQYVGQLETDTSTKVKDAVFGNVGTMISFRVGATDAEFLEKEFEPEFMGVDLINLPNHHVYLKLMVDGTTSRPFSAATIPPLQFEQDPSVKEKIIRVSRERYARPRAEVEEKISRWSGVGDGPGEVNVGGGGGSDGKSYESLCWNCGKQTKVPFKPDGKRPIYCLTCLKQIEEGKLIPLPERMPQLAARTRFSDSLGTLGIEFSPADKGEQPRPRAVPDSSRSGARPTRPRQGFDLSPSQQRRMPPLASAPGAIRPRAPSGTPPPRNTIFQGTNVVRNAPGAHAKPISLAELKPREKTPHPPAKDMSRSRVPQPRVPGSARVSVDLAQLRHALEEAQGKKSEIQTAPHDQEILSPESQPRKEKEKKVLAPGEAVKF